MQSEQRKQGLICFLLLILLPTGVLRASSGSPDEKAPPHVYVDVGACPFECCKYRQWTVEEKTVLLDRPKGQRTVTTLSKGEVVTGLTGQVISTPIPVKADRDVPDTPIKIGDTFYVLHYDGEGYWKVWLRGKITYVHQSVINVPRPESEWWVKIKDSRGKIGWALSHGNFAHQDSCE